jgi:hypothetical protein
VATLVNKVGGFEHARAVGINRDDDDVGGPGGRIRDHERPPGSPQNRRSNGGYEHAGGARQHNHQHDRNPSSPPRGHVLHDTTWGHVLHGLCRGHVMWPPLF